MPKLRPVKRPGTVAYKAIEEKKQAPILRSTVIKPKLLTLSDETEESK